MMFSESSSTLKPRVIVREVNGEQFHVVLPPLPNDEVLVNLYQVQNMCNRLRIPTTVFGFEIDQTTGSIKETDVL